MKVTFVHQPSQLPELADALAGASRIAIDVEWRPTGLYADNDGAAHAGTPASTLQLALDGDTADAPLRVFVIDLLAMNVRAGGT